MFEIVHYLFSQGSQEPQIETIYNPLWTMSEYGLIEATLSVELNIAGTLEFVMPMQHPKYGNLKIRESECAVLQDGEEIWRGFVSGISVDFDGSKTITCSGVLAYLNDSVVMVPKGSYTPLELLDRLLIENHNAQMMKSESGETVWKRPMANKQFTVSSDDVDISDSLYFEESNSYEVTWSIIESRLLSELGGYLKVWRDPDDGTNHISYKEAPGNENADSTQLVRYGVNLLDLDFSVSTEDFFTVLLPVAQSVSNSGSLIVLDPVVNTKGAEQYGYIWEVFSLDRNDAKTDRELEQLLAEEASKKIAKAGVITSIEGSALDWHNVDVNTDAIVLGDSHLIYSPPNGVYGYRDESGKGFVCNKIEYDLLTWEQSTYSFGDTEQSMTTQQIYNANKIAEELQRRSMEADALKEQADALKEQFENAITPFSIMYSLAANDEMTCDKTVGELVDALKVGKQIIAINRGNGDWLTLSASYSFSPTSELYTIIFIANATGQKWSGSGLSSEDTIVLQKVV